MARSASRSSTAPFILAALFGSTLATPQPFAKPQPDARGVAAESAGARAARLWDRAHARHYANHFDLTGLPHYVPDGQVRGTLRIYGNNYIGDSGLAANWEAAFRKFQPGVTFDDYLPSAAVALPGLYFGKADLAMNHMPSFYDLLGFVRIKGYAPTQISAVTGAYDVTGWQNTLVIVTNRLNPIKGITVPQLDGVFGSSRDGGWEGITWHPEYARGADRDIRTWGQLGLAGKWASKPIHVYGFSPRYATAVEFSNRILNASDKWNGDLHAYGNYVDASGVRHLETDQIVEKLKDDVDSIGYVRYHPGMPEYLKILPVAASSGGPYVEFTIENVQARRYPLWGEQNFYVDVKPGSAMAPAVREFLRFVLSQEGQELVQQDGKYLPLTAEVAREQLQKLH